MHRMTVVALELHLVVRLSLIAWLHLLVLRYFVSLLVVLEVGDHLRNSRMLVELVVQTLPFDYLVAELELDRLGRLLVVLVESLCFGRSSSHRLEDLRVLDLLLVLVLDLVHVDAGIEVVLEG